MILVAAMDPMGVIGLNGKLPWSFPQDLKYFKNLTSGHIVVMGRRTWQSLPCKPLPNRDNIVFSRIMLPEDAPGAIIVKDVVELQKAVISIPDKYIFLIGGAQLYTELIEWCDDMVITHVKKRHPGDTYFLWDWMQWEPVADLYQDADIRIVHYKRILNGSTE
jgi:dihydrofolate reductase